MATCKQCMWGEDLVNLSKNEYSKNDKKQRQKQ